MAHGLPTEHAEICSQRMIESDLRGQAGHGISRLPNYSKRLEAGGVNRRPDIHVDRSTAVSGLVNGDNGMGQIVMSYATNLAIEKANSSGLAWIGVRESNHAGALGAYVQMAVDRDLICIILAVSNVNQMAPWGGVDRLLGTNPIAVGIPAGDETSIILDMATTSVSYGTVRRTVQLGRQLPAGWMIDRSGQPLTDPKRVDDGLLLPIGGYKGYGLSLVIAVLAGILNGGAVGSHVVDIYEDAQTPTNTGQTIIALKPDVFMNVAEFKRQSDAYIRELKMSTPMFGSSIRIPGEGASLRRGELLENGITIPQNLSAELSAIAQRYGVVAL